MRCVKFIDTVDVKYDVSDEYESDDCCDIKQRYTYNLLYLGYAKIYCFYNGTLNLLFLARFCKTLFLPEFLSNQLEIDTTFPG